MTHCSGVTIKTSDTEKDYSASWELPPDLQRHLEDLKKNFPEALAIICRLVARSVYLACDLPLEEPKKSRQLAKPKEEEHGEGLEVPEEPPAEPPTLALIVIEMDVLDELTPVCEGQGKERDRLLYEPVPESLKYWNDWNEGHVMKAVEECRSYWSQVREVYLAPLKPVATESAAIGAAKGLARAARSRRGKKTTALEEAGPPLFMLETNQVESCHDGFNRSCCSQQTFPSISILQTFFKNLG